MNAVVKAPDHDAEKVDRSSLIGEVQARLARIAGEVEGIKSADVLVAQDVASLAETLFKLQVQASCLALECAAKSPKQAAAPAILEPMPLALLSDCSQHLTLIQGIDARAAALLNDNGIHTFADIAALTEEDVAELGRLIGDKRRISKQGWIEQAALLAAGAETVYSKRVRSGMLACVVPVPLATIETKPSAVVVDLAAKRAQRQAAKSAEPIRSGVIRFSAIAASAAACAVLSFDNVDLIQQIISDLWAKGGCSNALTALFSQCTVALLQ